MGNGQRTLWRILAGVLGVLVVGTGLTLAIRSERHAVSVKASLHHSHAKKHHPKNGRSRTTKSHAPRVISTANPLMMPVQGRIETEFGWQYSGVQNEWYYNPGITIAAKAGTPVKAAWAGTVENVQANPQTGVEVMVNDGDRFETVYAHLGKADVKAGQALKQGAVVGTVGPNNIYSHQTGAHVDFELYHAGLASNPVAYLHPSS
jgi:murein DD-endopeptidase MepM/ murein hydrolase activator NlpD